MASEYLIQKAKREVTPPEPVREYTRKEKAMNWLYYNKTWIFIGLVLTWIVGSMVYNVLGIGQKKPDLIIAYVGNRAISDEDLEKAEAEFSTLAEDLNGDGKTIISLRCYRLDYGGDLETAIYYKNASTTELIADITTGDSVVFLTEDPERIQLSYQLFANDEGIPPEESEYEVMDRVYAWENCPMLMELDLGEDFYSGLYIGRRGFYDEKQATKHNGSEVIWEKMIEGAMK